MTSTDQTPAPTGRTIELLQPILGLEPFVLVEVKGISETPQGEGLDLQVRYGGEVIESPNDAAEILAMAVDEMYNRPDVTRPDPRVQPPVDLVRVLVAALICDGDDRGPSDNPDDYARLSDAVGQLEPATLAWVGLPEGTDLRTVLAEINGDD